MAGFPASWIRGKGRTQHSPSRNALVLSMGMPARQRPWGTVKVTRLRGCNPAPPVAPPCPCSGGVRAKSLWKESFHSVLLESWAVT